MKVLRFIALFILIALNIPLSAQDKNIIVEDENSGKPMAVGIATREIFSDTSFAWWFNSEYENYTVDSTTLQGLPEGFPEGSAITIVMGTWCSDSRREVPRFFKILDYLEYPSENVSLIAVDREKKGLEGEVADLNIEFVPTIIFYEGDNEAGRIIESPQETLEADFVEIFSEE